MLEARALFNGVDANDLARSGVLVREKSSRGRSLGCQYARTSAMKA